MSEVQRKRRGRPRKQEGTPSLDSLPDERSEKAREVVTLQDLTQEGKVAGLAGTAPISIELPDLPDLSEIQPAYARQVEATLDPRQRRALRALYQALHETHARFWNRGNPKHVDRVSHVVAWLLDKVADAAEGKKGKKGK